MKILLKKLIPVVAGLFLMQNLYAQENGKVRPTCNDHGGVVAGHIEWQIATLRSGCKRGIGFRCGSHGWLICADQTILTWKGAELSKGLDPKRLGDAEILLNLKENTVVFRMLKPLPDEPEDDRAVFTVDEDVSIEMLGEFFVLGKPLKGIVIRKGDYKINYAGSEFGEVVFPADIQF